MPFAEVQRGQQVQPEGDFVVQVGTLCDTKLVVITSSPWHDSRSGLSIQILGATSTPLQKASDMPPEHSSPGHVMYLLSRPAKLEGSNLAAIMTRIEGLPSNYSFASQTSSSQASVEPTSKLKKSAAGKCKAKFILEVGFIETYEGPGMQSYS